MGKGLTLGGLLEAIRGVLDPGNSSAAEPYQRPGVLAMPEQTTGIAQELAANTSFSLPFSPGFLQGPVWPVEAWLLSSFQITLSGALVVAVALELKPETETLPVTLALVQSGRPVWSQNIDLRLVPELGTDKQRFRFQTSVFVDLINPLRYEPASQPQFVVSGLVPVYKPPGPTFESEMLEVSTEIVDQLEVAGAAQQDALSVLEQIATNTEGEG